MSEFIKSFKKRDIITFVITLLDCIFYYSMRPLWSGLGKVLNTQVVPIIFFVIMIIELAAVITLMALKKKGFYMWILFGLSIFWVVAFIIIFKNGGSDYFWFVMRNFGYALLIFLVLFIFFYLIFFYPKSKAKDSKLLKILVFSVPSVLLIFVLMGFRFNSFTYKPVVYAVEDNYQIVFTTRNNSTVSVKIGGNYYYDTYAGSSDTETYVHKVIVPMSDLDSKKEYTVYAKSMFYRGPFGAWQGKEISLNYTFYPVDSSDGLNYFSLSDVHGAVDAAIDAGSYYGDKLDFLVLAGDLVSYVNNATDANIANKLAYSITKGSHPVVYARGNHETKEESSASLYKYVGSTVEGNFYYWFKLENVFGIVLDIGEDHEDDWWEYYDTSHFEDYRNDQIEFLNNLDSSLYSGSTYRMCICHIPLVHINARDNFHDFKVTVTGILNTLSIDIHICGHQHQFIPFIPGTVAPLTKLKTKSSYVGDSLTGMFTDFNFFSMMVGKRSNTQAKDAQTFIRSEYGGMATTVDFSAKTETCTYINRKGEIILVDNPFVEGEPKSSIVYNLKNC